jgi:hypothetical protein
MTYRAQDGRAGVVERRYRDSRALFKKLQNNPAAERLLNWAFPPKVCVF